VEVEPADGTHVIWWHTPPGSMYRPFRLLMDPAPYEEYVAGYERSRAQSVFNGRLYARINRPGELVMLQGPTRITRTAGGVTSLGLDANGLARALRQEMGISDAIVASWIACGALDAAFEPPADPPPPPLTREPPSRR
jgi:hypothetical protein